MEDKNFLRNVTLFAEFSPEELSALRYLLDRALQPIDQWGGFDIIDQFQPAALRYQLNHMGFALGVSQSAYAPPPCFLRIESPFMSMRWALWTRRSRIPSATVGSPTCSCQRATGSCEVRIIDRVW